MEKSIYFLVSWRDAAELTRKLAKKKLRYAIRQLPDLQELAFVFPHVSLSQYVYLYILIGREGMEYRA